MMVRHRLLPSLALMLLCSCATLGPRFPSNVAQGFAQGPMRRMETRSLRLYYPAERQAEVLRMAARLEACVDQLGEKAGVRRDPVDVFVTRADFNNAYVQPLAPGMPQQMVMPGHVTLELFDWFGLGPGEVGNIACHEAVHYVQLQQVDGLFAVLNAITGGLLQPNVFTESWFLEGLATWYEGHLGARAGRPWSPIFRGWWQSGVAAEGGRLDFGYLLNANRKVVPFGGSYQTGYFFVDWLARTHGEEKLWALVRNVGAGVTLNVGITLRFRAVYGRDLAGLFDDFTRDLQAELAARERPASQRILARDLGYVARLASAPDGTLALISEGRQTLSALTVLEPDGRQRFRRWLTPLVPERPHIAGSPTSFSGLSFSADNASIFALLTDVDVNGNSLSRLMQFDAQDGALRRKWEGLVGTGGEVTPDGRGYVFVGVEGDTSNLVRLELATGAQQVLTHYRDQSSLGPPTVSPDGRRIAFPRWTELGFDLVLREHDGTLRPLTADTAFDYAPRWVDDRHLLFQREVDGRAQVALMDVDRGAFEVISDVPFLALDPAPGVDGRALLLNREGWNFTLDSIPLPERVTAEASGVPAAPSAPAAPGEGSAEVSAPAAVEVLADAPYSPLERLFVPQLRLPYVAAVTVPSGGDGLEVVVGAALEGADRLGQHFWLLNGYWDTAEQDFGGTVGYGNQQLAPWLLTASLSRTPFDPRLEWTARLSASRSFWTTPVTLSLLGFQRETQAGGGLETLRLVGPRVAVDYFAGDATLDGGLQRALGLGLSAAIYAARNHQGSALTAETAVGDLRGALTVAVPLPGLGTDSLLLSATGRVLPNAPPGLLRVGGLPPALSNLDFGLPRRQVELPDPSFGPLVFSEPVRGYEDVELAATRMALASARYRQAFIIDYGWANFLWLFPSFFVRQVDADLFGTWFVTDGAMQRHRVAGASLQLRTIFGGVLPVSLGYQFAWRFDDGLPPLHLVMLGF